MKNSLKDYKEKGNSYMVRGYVQKTFTLYMII